jgi:hypothetical protein
MLNSGGMTIPDIQRLKEQENNKLKRLLADSMLNNSALKTCCRESSKPAGQTRGIQNIDDRTRHGCLAGWYGFLVRYFSMNRAAKAPTKS